MPIKKAKKEDIKYLLKIADESSFITLTESHINYYIENDIYSVDLIFDDDNIYGFIIYSIILPEIEIIDIVIKGVCQKSGLGSILLNYLKSQNGIEKIILELHEKNIIAFNFYKKHEFKIIAKRENYYQKPYLGDALMMELLIKKFL